MQLGVGWGGGNGGSCLIIDSSTLFSTDILQLMEMKKISVRLLATVMICDVILPYVYSQTSFLSLLFFFKAIKNKIKHG